MRCKSIIVLSILLLLPNLLTFPLLVNADLEHPYVSARNAVLIEQESGRILFAKNEHEKRRIASITKIMTAILAIESGKLKEQVTVTEQAVNIEGSSIYLGQDEVISLEDLVYGLMLRSGNDAAVAIAYAVGGSVEGFVYLMNEKARALKMKNTRFANPHGLDDSDNHYSTAYDMALLTQYAMKNRTFREIFGTKSYKSSSLNDEEKRIRYWRNKHKLVTGLYQFTTGGKTGYTKRAKRTLVSTASKNDLDIIAVTLNAPRDWQDHIAMFEFAYENFENVQLVNSGKYKQAKDRFYKNKLFIKRPVYFPLSEIEKNNVQSSLVLHQPPKGNEWMKSGVPEPVGQLKILLDGEQVTSIPLFFDGDPVQQKENMFLKRLKNLLFNSGRVERRD